MDSSTSWSLSAGEITAASCWRLNCHAELLRHVDVHQAVGPAALESAAALARPVVQRDVQDVVAGFAESRGRRGFARERFIRGRLTLVLFHFRLGLGERNRAGTAEH